MRVFGNFHIKFTGDVDFVREVPVAEVTVHSGEPELKQRIGLNYDHVSRIGKWTPQDGFEFNGTPHGLLKR
jgi:hypothetical protein